MIRAAELEIPALVPWVNSNDRGKWQKFHGLTQAWRDAACRAANGFPTYRERVRIVITFHKARAGRYDPANLYPTAKAIVDGLVDAGVLEDDSHRYVEGPDMRHGAVRRGAPAVHVWIGPPLNEGDE